MKLSDIMSEAGLSIYPEIGLIIFLAVFASVIYRTFRCHTASELRRFGSLPLEDNSQNHARAIETEGNPAP